MSGLSAIAYKRDSAGKLRSWQAEVEGDKYRTIAGLVGGSLVTSAWTTCIGKQKRSNEEQAQFEANAELTKKIDREYRLDHAKLDEVPPSPMLAKKYEDEKDRVAASFDNPGVYSQPKLDGIRAFVSRHGAFSREYQRHLNVDHILKALAPVFERCPDAILDGELYNHDLKEDFNKIASVVRKQKPDEAQRTEAEKLIQYHVYDLVTAQSFGTRNKALRMMFDGDCGPIVLVPTSQALNQAVLDDMDGIYIQQGYEGQMVRINGPYEVDKRSKFLLKRKEFITEEFPIKRIEEGLGNWAGYAKRVVLDIPEAPEGEVGAGMRGTQDFAKKLLANATSYKQATVRHFGRTPDQSLRFPVVIDFHREARVD